MKSPKRALLYGLGVWAGLVLISLILLPAEGKHEALYESIKLTVMVGVVLGFCVAYLGRQASASLSEGVLVGLGWAVICVALDLILYASGAFNIGLGVYFTDVASSYLVMPVVAGVTMGYLRRATAETNTAETNTTEINTTETNTADQTPPASG